MDVLSEGLSAEVVGLGEDAYLEYISQLYSVRICTVPGNGSCFFDSIFALLPTVGKAVKSPKALRLSCVDFFRQCFRGQHGDAGERIVDDVAAVLQTKIVSSCATTRYNNKAPKTAEKYFEAVSLQSVWVEGVLHMVISFRCTLNL